jgi:hypothetical protein
MVSAGAAFTRDRAVLTEAQSDHDLVRLADDLDEHGTRYVRLLLRMLQHVTLIVLHPSTQQGFELVIDGIVDNFQLHTLLADALIVEKRNFFRRSGPSWGIEGQRPSPAIVSVMRGDGPQSIGGSSDGVWNLYQWTAINAAGQLPNAADGATGKADARHWIWGEGIPADIAAFDGRRVVVLGPPSYQRSWNTARRFAALPARVEVRKVLTADETREWLARFAARAPGAKG